MLIISGLLTLLVISHAGSAGIKGGLHSIGGTFSQEQVAQEDIPAPYSVKTASAFGAKVATGDADGRIKESMSKKAPASALLHSVKTVDRPSKTHHVPGLHHAATSPVVQDQVLIDESPVDSTGIKALKTITSGKTRFSQSDSQVRDPVARPIVQTTKTVQDSAFDSSQGVKTLKTTDTIKTRQRDPTARPVIQTLQRSVDTTLDSTKTLKTVTSGKTRFSQEDTQVRDPTALPVIQTVKTGQDPLQQTVKTSIKTQPSVIRRKSVKSSQKNIESASASSAPESIVQAARRNTLRISVPDSELTGNPGVSTGSTNVQGIQLLSNLKSQTPSGFGIVNEKGEITLNEETIIYLQNAGGIVRENGEITLNEEGIRLLQSIGGSGINNTPYGMTGVERTNNAVITRPILRTTEFDQTGRVSSQNQRQSTRRILVSQNNNNNLNTQNRQRGIQVTTSRENFRSQAAAGIRQSTGNTNAEKIIFNGKEINIDGLKPGQLFNENLQPILTDKADISRPADVRISSPLQTRQPVRTSGVTQSAAVSSLTTNTGSRSRVSSGATRRRQQAVTTQREKVELRTPARAPISSPVPTGISAAGLRSQGAASIRQSVGSQETILFNGKEISVGGLQAGQLFDANLQPIVSDKAEISRASPVPQIPQPVRISGVTQSAAVSSLTSNTGSRSRVSSGATRRRQQAVTTQREKVELRTPARAPISSPVPTGISAAGLRSQGAAGIRQSVGSQETILFNGKEISVGGLQAGQLFDANLQPIVSDKAEISRVSPVPQIPQPVRTSGITQTAAVSSLTSNTGSRSRVSSGATRRRQQAVTTQREKVELRTPARAPISSPVPTGISAAGLRSQGAAGIRQSVGSQETILFNGKEISVGGLQAGQLFDANLQPIVSDKAEISRVSPVPQIPQPVRTSGITQTAAVSSLTSNTGSRSRVSSGATRRRQQAVTTQREKVELRTPARAPISSPVPTGISAAGLRSQGAAGIRQSVGSQETILFNGKEISVGGLQAGQLFDANLQPIVSDKAEISRVSPVPQIPQPVRTSGITQTAAVSSLTSNTGSRSRVSSGATRRRQQAVTTQREKVELRTPARAPISSPVPTGISAAGLRSQGAAGIRQSVGSQETILFNGKEISVGGLQAGQLFDANLQPIVSDKAEISRASPVPQIPQPVRTSGVTQSAAVSSLTSNTGSRSRVSSGATRRRQQAVTTQREKVELRTPARAPISSPVPTGISAAGLRSQGAAGIRQSVGSQETILFNGKEISVGGLQAGQLFDANLQPIVSDKAEISRASPVPQIPQPVRTSGVTQSAAVSSLTSNTGSRSRVSSGATRRRQQAVTTQREKVELRTPARAPISSPVPTGISAAGLRSQGAAGIRQSVGSQETILFNGKEISVGGIQAGQLFDANLQPIVSDKAEISRASPVPQIPQPIRTSGVTQSAAVSSLTSNTGSRSRVSSGATRRRQQAVSTQREKVEPRTPARAPISSPVQTGISAAGFGSQGAAGIRQSVESQETILFNGKEISVGGLQAGQLFDANLQPIVSDKADISRASPVPQIPQPVRTSGVTQTAAVSSLTSNTGSRSRVSSGATRRQQIVSTQREKVEMRTPARAAISSPVQTGVSRAGLRSQGAAGIRQSVGSQETIMFNGKEISVGGLKAGQLFDANLQPIVSDNAGISRASPVPQIPQPVRTSGVTQTAAVSSLTSNTGSRSRVSSGATRRRQQVVSTQREKVELRTPAKAPISSPVQTGIPAAGLRSQGATGIRQSVGSQETITFNGKEISVGGLKPGQLFDANLQPILTDKAEISRVSPVPQIPQPVRTSGVTQTAAVSSLTSNTGSRTRVSSGTTRRRQQAVNIPREKVELRTPARAPVSSPVQAGFSTAGVRSQGAAGITETTRVGSQETILFNGKEISVGGLEAGQLFDANLQPIVSDKAEISRASPVPQIPQPVRTSGVTQTAALSSLTSNTGSRSRVSSGATRRRQQVVSTQREKVELRTPARAPISSPVQAGISAAGLRSQGAAGIRQSVGSQETILFNGKEISVGGLQAGQLFDANLQPIVSDKAEISRTSPVPQIPQPVRTSGVTQSAAVSSLTSNIGSRSRVSGGATRQRQQAVSTQREKVDLRTPARTPISSPVQTGISGAGLRSQGAAGIRQSVGSQETILFNGKEISVGGLEAGQLFDANLQPILTDKAEISNPADFGSPSLPQVPQPFRSGGVTQTTAVSALTSNSGSRSSVSSGSIRRRQQAIPIPREKVELRTPVRAVISSAAQSSRTTGGLRSQSGASVRQPTTNAGNPNSIFFNGKEISVSGLQAGQLFDENLQPILSDKADRSSNVRTSTIPEISQPVTLSGMRQTSGISSVSSNTGSRRPASLTTNIRGSSVSTSVSDSSITRASGFGARDSSRKPTDSSVRTQVSSTSRGSELRASGLPVRQFASRPVSSRNQGQSSSQYTVPKSGTALNAETVFFNGKEISIGGLREGQLFDENLRPIMSDNNSDNINIPGRLGTAERSSASGLRTGIESQRTSPASIMRSGGLSGDSRSYFDSSRSSSSQSPGPFTSRRVSFADQNSNSRGAENVASGIMQFNAGDIASTYDTGARGSNFQRKYSQDSLTQEISQDRFEAPVIQEKQEIPVLPQYLIDSQQKIQISDPTTKSVSLKAPSGSGSYKAPARRISQKAVEPTESKQTQMKVEDILEQRSVTNPAAQKTVPFTIPITSSKSSFTKISQVSQKNIDIPTVQQQVMTSDFSGYLPKASFLPPFNYGVPVVSASKYGVKSPIVQEQQKVEQEFL